MSSERRQRGHRTGGVGQVEVGVDVHRQANIAMTHNLLGRGGHDAVTGQQCSEGVAKAVNVYCSALGAAFGDAGGGDVEIERPQQVPPVDVEQQGVGRNASHRAAVGRQGAISPTSRHACNMLAEVIGEVAAQRQRCAFPALGVPALDLDV